MVKPQRVRIMQQHKVKPLPLPPVEEIKAKMKLHPQVATLKEGKLREWFTAPLENSAWSAWGRRAKPEPRGMTYASMNAVSTAPEPPETGSSTLVLSRFIKVKTDTSTQTELTRGGAPKYGSTRELEHRYQVWIDDAGNLAEEALSRQWRPQRSMRWEEMERLPADLERATDQLMTHLIACQYLCSDIMGPYIGRIHYAFLEVKGYLAYELFDYNLHAGMLHKRIRANGGGMGSQVEGYDAGVLEVCNEASQAFEGEVERDFNSMVFAMDVLFNGIVLDILRLAEGSARSRFDQAMYRQMIQDNARHVAWGCKRLRYYLDHCPNGEEAVDKLHAAADLIEPEQTAKHLLNPKVLEPLAILLGGGTATVEQGYEALREFWPQISERYLARLDHIGLPRRNRCLIPSEAPF